MDNRMKNQVFEAFNTVRTNLGFLNVDRELKVIMVISSVKGEGKSTVAANLANSIAGTEQKVLMVDADLRDPSIHRMFYLANRKGLTDLICSRADDKTPDEFINRFNPYLDILTSGHKPPNPSELLGSRRMKNILEYMRKQYDFIIIDTPPFLFISDALALSKYVDGTILVSRYAYTTKEILRNAKDRLELANIQPLACILNAVDGIQKKYVYYGYTEYVPEPPPKETEGQDEDVTFQRRQAHRARA